MLDLPDFVCVLAMTALIVVLCKALIDGTPGLVSSAPRPARTGNCSADESRPMRPARSRLNATPLAHRARPQPMPESAGRAATSLPVQEPNLDFSDDLSSRSSLTICSSSPGGPAIIDGREACPLEGPGPHPLSEELDRGLEKKPPRSPRWRSPMSAQAKTADSPRSEREWAIWASAADIVASPPGQTTPVPRRT